MKAIYKINIFLVVSLLVLVGCTQSDFKDVNIDPWVGKYIPPTYTIQQVTEKFLDPTVVYSSVKIESPDSIVINGIITSTDDGGNVYKYFVIQEEIPNGRSIRVSVDVAGISSVYHLGRRVSVYLNGLYIGNYGRVPQIGVDGQRLSDGRVQPMGMPYSEAEKHIFPYDAPDKASVVPVTMTIEQIRNTPIAQLNYKLVHIKDAWFTGKGANFNIPGDITNPADRIFAPGTGGVGFPQSREIQDGTGSIFVSTSEYAKFASYPLPSDTIKGDVTALVVWYSTSSKAVPNPDSGEIYFQLTLRTLNDLGEGYGRYHETLKAKGDGTETSPYNIGAAFANQGAQGYKWVKGYVVGVWEDERNLANFEPPFYSKLNILLSSSENETNEERTLCIQLPTGEIQDFLNLVNNGSLHKKQVLLYGLLQGYNDFPGMKSVKYAVLEDGKTVGTKPVN